MSNIVYIAASIDGYIATPDGGVEWLNEIPNPDQSDFGWSEFILGIDAILMGRNTFEKVLTFGDWPYQKPVFVLSAKLKKVPDELSEKAEIIKGSIEDVIAELNQRGHTHIYIDGGKLIQSFLAEDLIDELIITRIPILLGKGIPLFRELEQSQKFIHKKTEIFNDSLVKSHYDRE